MQNLPFKDYFRVLDISPSASDAEIRSRYKDILREFKARPIESLSSYDLVRMNEVKEAYSVLRDPEAKESYTKSWLSTQHDRSDMLKRQANASYRQEKYTESIHLFSEAIGLDPTNATLYSNRSMAYGAISDWVSSRNDAIKAVTLNRHYMKGHYNLVRALAKMGLLEQASSAIAEAIELFPDDENINRISTELKTLIYQKDHPKLPPQMIDEGVDADEPHDASTPIEPTATPDAQSSHSTEHTTMATHFMASLMNEEELPKSVPAIQAYKPSFVSSSLLPSVEDPFIMAPPPQVQRPPPFLVQPTINQYNPLDMVRYGAYVKPESYRTKKVQWIPDRVVKMPVMPVSRSVDDERIHSASDKHAPNGNAGDVLEEDDAHESVMTSQQVSRVPSVQKEQRDEANDSLPSSRKSYFNGDDIDMMNNNTPLIRNEFDD